MTNNAHLRCVHQGFWELPSIEAGGALYVLSPKPLPKGPWSRSVQPGIALCKLHGEDLVDRFDASMMSSEGIASDQLVYVHEAAAQATEGTSSSGVPIDGSTVVVGDNVRTMSIGTLMLLSPVSYRRLQLQRQLDLLDAIRDTQTTWSSLNEGLFNGLFGGPNFATTPRHGAPRWSRPNILDFGPAATAYGCNTPGCPFCGTDEVLIEVTTMYFVFSEDDPKSDAPTEEPEAAGDDNNETDDEAGNEG